MFFQIVMSNFIIAIFFLQQLNVTAILDTQPFDRTFNVTIDITRRNEDHGNHLDYLVCRMKDLKLDESKQQIFRHDAC